MKTILGASHMLVSVLALVIGSNGQDGKILVSKLASLGYQILTVSRSTVCLDSRTIDYCDLTNVNTAHKFLSDFQPNLIFHVAAVHGSSETQSSAIAQHRNAMYDCHVGITNNILTWLISSPATRFHVALSSQMYTASRLADPVHEGTPTDPQNFYGETKSEAWANIKIFRQRYDLLVSASILFNHASEFSRADFVFSQLSDQFVEVMHGKSDSISLRKPFADIDITSAFEICDAMILNINQVPDQDFVLASGRTIKLNELVMRVASEIGVTKKISNLEGLMKHVEPESHPFVRSNPSKASIILGWEASSTPEEILMEMISHREKAGKN